MRCDVCLREIKDVRYAMVFWELGDNRRVTALLVAHKGGRHQGSVGCDPNFRYSWELQTILAQGDEFLSKMQEEFWLPQWAAVKLLATLGRDVSDRVGDGK